MPAGELERKLEQPGKEGEEAKQSVVADQEPPQPDPTRQPWPESDAWSLFQLRARQLGVHQLVLAKGHLRWLAVGGGDVNSQVFIILYTWGKVSSVAPGKPRRIAGGLRKR